MSFNQKAFSRPVRASALPADTLGDWFGKRCYRTDHESAHATGSRGSVEDDGFTTRYDCLEKAPPGNRWIASRTTNFNPLPPKVK